MLFLFFLKKKLKKNTRNISFQICTKVCALFNINYTMNDKT